LANIDKDAECNSLILPCIRQNVRSMLDALLLMAYHSKESEKIFDLIESLAGKDKSLGTEKQIHWRPPQRGQINFRGLVECLKGSARRIRQQNNSINNLEVIGIDFN